MCSSGVLGGNLADFCCFLPFSEFPVSVFAKERRLHALGGARATRSPPCQGRAG